MARIAGQLDFVSSVAFETVLIKTVAQLGPVPSGAPSLSVERFETPLGSLLVAASDAGLAVLEFTDPERLGRQLDRLRRRVRCRLVPGLTGASEQAGRELEGYFAGRLRQFSVPLAPAGTEFQRAVWQRLESIPFGETMSYGDQARQIGRPRAVRAVAQANGANPISIVVPCHRVIGSDGTLTGYGGGLWRKRWLLAHESGLPADSI